MSLAPRKVVVVGAGPVGCLAAMSFAQMGWNVEIYEGRPDMRLPSSKAAALQRSINLAISSRGIAALEAIDPQVAERFLRTVIPMKGRMIHNDQGKLVSQLYDDRDGQCINSIDRALLNEGLLEEVSAKPNIRMVFKHKVQTIDFDRRFLTVTDLDGNESHDITFDFLIGADGSYSVVRRQVMRIIRMDYQQEYISHEYLELKIPAGIDSNGASTFLLDQNHLHIWPRHAFMLIALPNKDRSFTCTLFAPTAEFNRLDSRETILEWFGRYFSDAFSLIGEEALLRDFERNPRSPLISIKANPYHYKDVAIILGDAAHSMVPFYGQGLNCGFEDVRVLDALLRSAGVSAISPEAKPTAPRVIDQLMANALSRYTSMRHKDLVAICDLAMNNYVEMRHSVTTLSYLVRKALDNILFSLSACPRVPHASGARASSFPSGKPSGWLPLYTMVTFRPDIGYSAAREKARHQERILSMLGWLGTAILGVASVGITWITLSHRTLRPC